MIAYLICKILENPIVHMALTPNILTIVVATSIIISLEIIDYSSYVARLLRNWTSTPKTGDSTVLWAEIPAFWVLCSELECGETYPESLLSQGCCSQKAESCRGQSLGNVGSGSYCFHDVVEGKGEERMVSYQWGRQIKERGVYVYPGLCFFPIVEGNTDEMDGIDAGKNTRKRDRLKTGYRTGLACFYMQRQFEPSYPLTSPINVHTWSKFLGLLVPQLACLLAFFF